MSELYEDSYQREKHFSFGKNWLSFLQKLNDERIDVAKKSITDFLGGEDKIKGKSFLDIGCGSGLFSLSAFLLGAKKVVSFDADVSSVECAKHLKHRFGKDADSWEIFHGSILDKELVSRLGTFDIVYSWGVLHHTGDMWTAIENAMSLVREQGLFYISIYNERNKIESSAFWLKVKKVYNSGNWVVKKMIEGLFIVQFFLIGIIVFENRIKYIKNYQSCRGMSWYTDIVDWLGGYPYEYAKVDKVQVFFEERGFTLRNVKESGRDGEGLGCNEFLFQKS